MTFCDERLTSASGNRAKNIIRLKDKARERQKQGLFIVEGRRIMEEVPAALIEGVYVSSSYRRRFANEFAGLDVQAFEVADEVFSRLSDTRTPQGILAVVRIPKYELKTDIIDRAGMLLVLENVQDPGNVGTCIRCAEGANAAGVLISVDSADIFSPKVVRSTMGTIFRMPYYIYGEGSTALIETLRADDVRSYAAYLDGSVSYDEADFAGDKSFAIFIGNEGNGLREETAAACDERIRIPMGGRLESLNAAMSAGIIMYEAARQIRRR